MMNEEMESAYIEVLRKSLVAIEEVDRTGDTQVFSHYVAPILIPTIKQLLDAYTLRSNPSGIKKISGGVEGSSA